MKQSTERIILRWIHLVLTIPILGYIYAAPAEARQYAPATRFVFVPLIMLTGYWMYAGAPFAILGVVAWLGVYHFFGYNWAILGQVVLFAGRKIWLLVLRRRSK